MSKQPLCYMYLRDKVKGQEKKGFPGTLISYSIERPTAETHIVSYGLATFNTKDKKAIYSRRFLREIAVGRLHIEPKTITLNTKDYNSLRAIQHAIIVAMGEDKGLPTRAQKAIRHWMKETTKQEIKQATVKEEVLLLCVENNQWEKDLTKGKFYKGIRSSAKPNSYDILKTDSNFDLLTLDKTFFQEVPQQHLHS